ncbi:MAG: hypothetical protein F6K25_25670 [Okeania sp. SIO2G4]|uniref:hypothetical protein n=1 Tax=unclassified Okeania TaxID=2634635 RepID=UPI0013B7CB8B|nr:MULTISPECIES: hypothetical protein [unclassified Okeania]NEP07374.1 hypothetical protein [Okeania sp. SIO4D6]NEP72933.1 hypothetical protein [Okeania sp. SIO2G5]NEP93744.1 hypothetical protein [Okeania sp. SIO2F5]NEQ93857.1 hypothetical protein [Okeania sp. SIO2G4]
MVSFLDLKKKEGRSKKEEGRRKKEKAEVNPPLTPPRRGSRGFEQGTKNISNISL